MFFLLGAFTWQSFVVLQIITNPGVSAKIVHFVLRVCFNVHFVGVFAVYPTRNVTPRCRVDLRCFIFTQGHPRVLALICVQIVTPS